jgi:site-specific DNA-methyltransferase (adenine-specific)
LLTCPTADYGTTACSWDSIIPLEPLWEHYKRIIKPRGAIVLAASQPFTSKLAMSNLDWFKYEWVWRKDKATNHLNAWKMPMKNHENILVFGKVMPLYNPQITKKSPANIRPNPNRKFSPADGSHSYGAFGSSDRTIALDDKMPQSVLDDIYTTNTGERGLHPTQKPVALFAYLIRTYTNPGDLVLDNTIGSGTTAIACLNTNRDFIGIEKDEGYYNIAKHRALERTIELGKMTPDEIHALYDKTDTSKQGFQLGLPLDGHQSSETV